jgi:hypothetical protein
MQALVVLPDIGKFDQPAAISTIAALRSFDTACALRPTHPRFRTFQVYTKDARKRCADYGAAISVIAADTGQRGDIQCGIQGLRSTLRSRA